MERFRIEVEIADPAKFAAGIGGGRMGAEDALRSEAASWLAELGAEAVSVEKVSKEKE